MIRVAPGLRCLSLLGPRIGIRGYQTASPGLLPGDRKGNGLLNAVVKVFSTQSTPDFSMPWQNKPHEYTTGSGFISRTPVGLRILTNAHLVADTTFVQVRKHGNSERFEASVEALAHECDVAMLNVEDQKFWANSDPLVLADEIPQLQDNISVIGYPTGGENLSVTSGVVSRIEMQQYTHAATSLLAVQIDAAINSGNSGGPAVKDGWVYGIAFQNLAGADGIGFVIPTPVIHHFLDSVNSKSGYQRFCDLEVKCQDMENDHLREYYGMKAHDSGVLINKIAPLSSVSGLLKPGDVLISFDDVAIANDGTVDHPITGRINFQHLVSMKKVGEIAMLGAIRDGKKIKLTAAMAAPKYLVPVHSFDRDPRYFVIGGLVFTPLSQAFLQEYGEDWANSAPRRLVNTALYDLPKKNLKEAIVLADVLPHSITAGYQKLVDLRLLKFNGVEVQDLSHLVKLVQKSTGRFFRFELEDDREIVLLADKTRRASQSILRRYRIQAPQYAL